MADPAIGLSSEGSIFGGGQLFGELICQGQFFRSTNHFHNRYICH